MELSRRTVLRAGLGVGTTLALGACGGTSLEAAAGEPVRLTYWSWLKGLDKVTDIWNAKNPHVQVETVWIKSGNQGGYQKLFSALASGGGPDLAHVELRQASAFMMVDGLVDTTQYGADAVTDRFEASVLNQVTFNGGVYGLPQDSGPTAFFYRTDIMEAIGAEPPATWQDWAAVAREYRAADRYLECFPIADGGYFCAYAMQAGANWFQIDGDSWVIDMTDDATLEVAAFFDRAIDEDLVNVSISPFSPGWFAAAGTGQLGAITSASWADALIEGVGGTEGLWRVAPMPRWTGGFGSAQLGGSTVATMSSSRHPQEATDFAMWMTTDPEAIDAQILHCGIGWSPVSDYIGTPRLQPSEFFGGQNYNTEVFVPAAQQQNPNWSWAPTTQQVFNVLSDGFRTKLTDGVPLVDSCRATQDATVRMLKNKGLNVRAA